MQTIKIKQDIQDILDNAKKFIKQIVQQAHESSSLTIHKAGLNDRHISFLVQACRDLDFIPTIISLKDNKITDTGFIELITYCQDHLKTIDISNNCITVAAIKYFVELESMHLLQINFSNNNLISKKDSDVLKILLATKEQLFIKQTVLKARESRSITIYESKLSDKHISFLVQACTEFNFIPTVISLKDNEVTDAGFIELIDYCKDHLTIMDISNNHITIEGIRYLAHLKSIPLLKKIDISNNDLSQQDSAELKILLSKKANNNYKQIFVTIDNKVLSTEEILDIQADKLDSPVHSPRSKLKI